MTSLSPPTSFPLSSGLNSSWDIDRWNMIGGKKTSEIWAAKRGGEERETLDERFAGRERGRQEGKRRRQKACLGACVSQRLLLPWRPCRCWGSSADCSCRTCFFFFRFKRSACRFQQKRSHVNENRCLRWRREHVIWAHVDSWMSRITDACAKRTWDLCAGLKRWRSSRTCKTKKKCRNLKITFSLQNELRKTLS